MSSPKAKTKYPDLSGKRSKKASPSQSSPTNESAVPSKSTGSAAKSSSSSPLSILPKDNTKTSSKTGMPGHKFKKPDPVETVDPFTAAIESFKPVIKARDMSELMANQALDVVKTGLINKDEERDIAARMKHFFDQNYGPSWNCIVGTSYASFISHSTNNFVYFEYGPLFTLLFK